MSDAVTFALIGIVVVVLILFWLAADKYLGEVMREVDEEDENGQGGTSH